MSRKFSQFVGKNFILLEPEGKPTASLIWLHGLGDTMYGFKSFFQEKISPIHDGVRIKLLNAPIQKVTINSGMQMTSWYDILSLGGSSPQRSYNYEQIKQSGKAVLEHIESEREKVDKVFLGGFSQGCVMSLYVGLHLTKLSGIIALSGYLVKQAQLNYQQTPLFVQHGIYDQTIPIQLAKGSYNRLKGLKSLRWKEVQLGHGVNFSQLKQIREFINENLI